MIRCVLSAFLLAISCGLSAGKAWSSDPPHVFDVPALQARHVESLRGARELLQRGAHAEAEEVLREAIKRVPHDVTCHYNLARILALRNQNEEALDALHKAVEFGFRDADHIRGDQSLRALRKTDRFSDILELANRPLEGKATGWQYQVKPATSVDGKVRVAASNTAWESGSGVFQTFFKLDPPRSDQPISTQEGIVGDLLRVWDMEETAAGNHGDLYDNHDGGHSTMNYQALPRLTRIEFSQEARRRKLHMGAQLSFLYRRPDQESSPYYATIGNSSTAVTSGALWRSQPRYALTQPRGPATLYRQYVSNHLYFYPEHRDHDPAGEEKGHGDLFPANTPYMIISQGSSGSDRPFMNAVGATLAAFRPAAKKKLMTSRTLIPAIQMIFRTSNKMLETPADYLTGRAHPTVFKGKQINEEKMVRMAHRMTRDSLPPMVQLKVVEEDEATVGRDYFDATSRERFFDTPCAIARVVKSTRYTRRMVVSAEASKDLAGQPLTYHWVLLRGDSERVRINKLNDAGSKVELLVSYHPRRPIAPGAEMESNRVDIGCFVHNGQYYSAPGFICFHYLNNEKRVYDDEKRILVVDYTDPEYKKNYVDPLLDNRKNWRDEYHYDEQGNRLGWTRIRGDQEQEFTADGRLILERNAAGEPTQTTPVRYVVEQSSRGNAPRLKQVVVDDSN
ncbi:MAG: TPR end-of-group domain-containing protein [Planctomycetota bacterium]